MVFGAVLCELIVIEFCSIGGFRARSYVRRFFWVSGEKAGAPIALPCGCFGALFCGNFPMIDSVRVLDDPSDTQVDLARGSPTMFAAADGRFRLDRS